MRNQFIRALASPSVQAEQVRYYGKTRVPPASDQPQPLGLDEQNFIEARDSFYMATIGQDAWPYIQHRGGPKGFLKVLNGTQLAFGDYNGNRQLISTGNIKASQRVALFLMDYPARERLKIIGHAEVLTPLEANELLEQLVVPKGSMIERVFRVDILGFDWNCPKYITPRFTADEVEQAIAPLKVRIAELEATLSRTST
jgi:predicted pyridoxine 5'-phosphate oxidase superfamily flavin-nucleotide-binding protein